MNNNEDQKFDNNIYNNLDMDYNNENELVNITGRNTLNKNNGNNKLNDIEDKFADDMSVNNNEDNNKSEE